jgi:hypothetical protein
MIYLFICSVLYNHFIVIGRVQARALQLHRVPQPQNILVDQACRSRSALEFHFLFERQHRT